MEIEKKDIIETKETLTRIADALEGIERLVREVKEYYMRKKPFLMPCSYSTK
ncbi:MAG: hypothetical protein V1910_01595 [bacterium]